jgi:hypothetical protein
MLFRRLTSALLLACATIPSAWAGNQYADPAGRFTVALPAEWQAAKPEGTQVAAVIGKLEGEQIVGLCLVVVTETPQTVGKSQDEIDQAMQTVLSKEFWQSTYKSQGGENVVISTVGARDAFGRKVNFVFSEFTSKGKDGKAQRMTAHEEVHALPGRMHDIGCLAKTERFAQASADFDAILKSYNPLSGLVAQAPSVPTPTSVLTLYAQAGFGGAARVLKGETPNVTWVSWPTVTGSAMVSGFGEWEICEGADFTGNCTILAGAHTPAENALLRIGSVRPLSASTSLRGAASTVATDTAVLLNEALRKFANGH